MQNHGWLGGLGLVGVLVVISCTNGQGEKLQSVEQMASDYYLIKHYAEPAMAARDMVALDKAAALTCMPSSSTASPEAISCAAEQCGMTCHSTSSRACLEACCEHLGAFGCDDEEEIRAVSDACRGNLGEACVNEVCAHVSVFGCDDMGEILQVASSCNGVLGAGCVNQACGRLSVFGCDDLVEVTQVAAACQGLTDMECVSYVCERLGVFECDDLDEIVSVIGTCKGQ